MFEMTEAAGGYLSQVLDQARAPQDAAVRFVLEGDELATRLDVPRPGDATFDHDGRKVLVLDDQVVEALAGSKLDVQPTDDGARLVLTR